MQTAINVREILSATIGRRRKIKQGDMARILSALAEAGIDLANDCVYQESAAKWAAMCRGITCISVLAHGTTPHGEVRYDSPGDMHPLHRAALMFVPASMRGESVGYLRGKCERLIVVEEGGL